MQFVYFASIREAIGQDSETIELPSDVKTVSDCLKWLSNCDNKYAAAFINDEKLRFALDQNMVSADTIIGNAKEMAIFPPVTGG